MKASDVFDGVTDIRDDLVDAAKAAPQKRRRRAKARWLGAAAAALALAVAGSTLLRPGTALTAYALAQAQYPEMAPYPGEPHTEKAFDAWWEDVVAQRRNLGDTTALRAFFRNSTAVFLSDTNGQNKVYSPLNVYMALAMLAQLTDGDSRGQILALVGSDSIEALRKQAGDVWNANYRDDGALTSVLANSLWLNKDVAFNRDTIDTLARELYASSYQGEMGTDAYDKALQAWLTQQTGGLLGEQAGNITMDADTVLALATTVYYRAKWDWEFQTANTTPQTFHGPAGDSEVDFLHQRSEQTYYWGDDFAAVSQGFTEGGEMWFLLPDEGTTPEELLRDEQAMDLLFAGAEDKRENSKFLFVNKAIPKFDVASQFELGDGLQKLGVTDVFDPALADFTPMTAADMPITLSQASHAARVTIDEEGCTAAAFTVMEDTGAAMPPDDEVDFVLDRPFLFCITGLSGLPLFVGVVNSPAA